MNKASYILLTITKPSKAIQVYDTSKDLDLSLMLGIIFGVIDGVRYDRELLDQAHDLLNQNPQKKLSLSNLQHLILYATDAHLFTKAEKRTFLYISTNLSCSEEAKEWLMNDALMQAHAVYSYLYS